ncbi:MULTISPECIES: hypothetical protein [unclassified Enterococcus]|nr:MULTISPECIES: hypothetical protein [unclassified Enterococcus]
MINYNFTLVFIGKPGVAILAFLIHSNEVFKYQGFVSRSIVC